MKSVICVAITFALVGSVAPKSSPNGACENGKTPPYCCANGSSSPYCCANGSSSKYCCENGSSSLHCCGNNSPSPFCCENESMYSDCSPAGIGAEDPTIKSTTKAPAHSLSETSTTEDPDDFIFNFARSGGDKDDERQ